ncbi:acetoacetate--CoA ligase [Desulforhabdus amnigena]|jgi:acetoacetyl-CoA synthetase|uniref:Acetoacetyl-CoA synthetase n=1 Tax=Desulforhabdus amnigena TaxID=40218 RepID=A0A9W6D165_9BACT|nr:acetoacetate--CoA ligase [Desulforhabdus amnigena]NLJ29644.1 acetoacetate--CoA ligase [Deltaproteobacteria bacterium]GLI33084.1 acetoacetyl-CoA synthetase [Desulforhabdus amnigena]
MNKLLWKPAEERIRSTNMHQFMDYVKDQYQIPLHSYDDLYRWSITDISHFWEAVWNYAGVIHSRPFDRVVDDAQKLPGARWFEGARLNFAENLLRYRDDRLALSFKGETHAIVSITYAELYDKVARLACSLRTVGIKPGDRIAGFMPNMIETVIAMLASTSIGAIWSSCSPDFGSSGLLDRFGQIGPRILFTANGYSYGGKKFDSLATIGEIAKQLPTVEHIIVVPYTDPQPDISCLPGGELFDDFLVQGEAPELVFEQLPADHPVYIMYSSGTTGVPKCIVHGAAGTLIQHLKELKLHTDVKRGDTIFYYTTCGWMMWNWLVNSLALGARILLFDGSPFYPGPDVLWQLAQDEKVSIFGTSAKYLAAIEKAGSKPGKTFDLSSLKAVLSTGSPLSVESFEYVYREIKDDIVLSSISGGTDILSCFALGNPMGPVYAGELQCRGLGMKVEAYNDAGKPIIGEKGELVCTAAAPSMPIRFWNDPEGQKYRSAYFESYPGAWSHGDYIEITERGGVIVYGRSDATLNPGGVRIGTAEIYRQVETVPEVLDSLVIGQDWENDVRVILFVKLREGCELDEELLKRIKNTIRENTTPRHVPSKIIAIADIPYTLSGKKVELAVRNVIHGKEVKNRFALANPEALELYNGLQELMS